MADELKPPVAIRITRPYASEAEFLEREFDTLTHTSVVLLGAQARPQGVILRFEIVLKSGESILRGEGRVVGYKEKAHAGEAGLSLRFTRLDARSKTLVDRAAALRDARVRAATSLMPSPSMAVAKPFIPALDSSPRISTPPPPPPRPTPAPPPSRRGPPPLPGATKSDAPPAPVFPKTALMDIEATQVDAPFDRGPQPARQSVAPPPAPSSAPPPPAHPIRPSPARVSPQPRPVVDAPVRATDGKAVKSVDRPADRDALLTRLRVRAEALPAARVKEILAKSAPP